MLRVPSTTMSESLHKKFGLGEHIFNSHLSYVTSENTGLSFGYSIKN